MPCQRYRRRIKCGVPRITELVAFAGMFLRGVPIINKDRGVMQVGRTGFQSVIPLEWASSPSIKSDGQDAHPTKTDKLGRFGVRSALDSHFRVRQCDGGFLPLGAGLKPAPKDERPGRTGFPGMNIRPVRRPAATGTRSCRPD
jgi:hypothetical protein